MARQRIVVLVGLPASGKSTWLQKRGIQAISTDEIRRILSDDPTNQAIHARVFATVRYLLRQRLAIGCAATYVDATHLTRAEREPYIRIAEWYGCGVEALFFNTKLVDCLRRNASRARIVPEAAITAMAGRIQIPELWEGFDRLSLARQYQP